MKEVTAANVSELPPRADEDVRRACSEIYERELDFVWRNARRLGVPESACEDVVHEVFVVALKKLHSFEGRSSIRTWLYGILSHVVREHRRRDRARFFKESEHAAEQPSVTGDLTEELARKEAARVVDGILASMDEDKRTMFVLVDLEEISVVDAAKELGINANTAHARLRAARAQFADAVKRIHARRAHAESKWWIGGSSK